MKSVCVWRGCCGDDKQCTQGSATVCCMMALTNSVCEVCGCVCEECVCGGGAVVMALTILYALD